MEKEILIVSDKIERLTKVEYSLVNVRHSSNIDQINEDFKNSSPRFSYYQHQTLKSLINLKIHLEQKSIFINCEVFFQRYLNFEPLFGDDNGIEFLKYLTLNYEKPNSLVEIPYLENLLLLIQSNFYSIKDQEEAFFNINAETLLLDFESFKEFQYGVYFKEGKNLDQILSYQRRYGNMGILSILPLQYKDYYLKKNRSVLPQGILPTPENITLYPQGNLIFSGSYDQIYNTLENKKEFHNYMDDYFNKKTIEENKRYKNYDIRRDFDWSNYNDDLDKDQQDPDFWNQF